MISSFTFIDFNKACDVIHICILYVLYRDNMSKVFGIPDKLGNIIQMS